MSPGSPPKRALFPALFLVASSTIMFQVLLTRVFSLTMWYHFAFMAISMAMLGMTVGAIIVFLRPGAWPEPLLPAGMGGCALLFAASMAAVILLHTVFFVPNPHHDIWPMIATFIGAGVPFVFSGMFVSLALTRFPARVGQLYAADLVGAALGCVLVIVALFWLDGVAAVLCCATLAAAASMLLLRGAEKALAAVITAALAGATLWSGIHLARHELAAFPIQYIKWSDQQQIEYERWNSFSRIAVMKPNRWDVPAWSLSSAYPGPLDVPARSLQIDAGAGTLLIGFDGDLSRLEYLRWDLTNFVHHLRRNARVCIVGAGGGRDILATKVFGQKRVVALEINGNIMEVVNGRFGDYTGHLDRDPGVTLINDEARSYLTRTHDQFDIVQLTFIDTWAATAAGAYTLTENALYTVEGWKTFIDRLDDDGLLAVARAVNPELDRLVALGREALRAHGVSRPERHMVLVTNRHVRPQSFGAMGMLLVRKTPFPEAELAQIRSLAQQMNFDLDLLPGAGRSELLLAMASGRGMEDALASNPVNYDAPTDEQPFFFNMARLSGWKLMRNAELGGQQAAALLMDLLFAVLILTVLFIVLPLAAARTGLARRDAGLLLFFAAIGSGFMLIEISMLQRLIIFLGHPIYSLSVVLFILLLASGAGSWLSARVPDERLRAYGFKYLAALLVVLTAAGFAIPPLMAAFRGSETPVRIAVSAALLAAMGTFMGTAFPLGMRLAMGLRRRLTPWLWGVNGALSVLASVLAVVIAMGFGISKSFWSGVASYVVALVAFALAARQGGHPA